MKIILSLIIGGALVVSGFGQTRNVLVGTNNAVTQPTNFWSADAVNARAGLGLGSAATNPASAFQPSSLNLSNIAANNGGGLTNLNATSIVGVVSVAQGGTGSTNASDARIALGLGTAATNPATAFQTSSTALSNLATGNGGALSNLQSTNLVGLIPASNIPSVTFTNLAGTLAITQGGTGATNAANARQNLGSTTVGDAVFTATNATDARNAIGATTVGSSLFTLINPSAIRFLRLNADNTSSALTAADFRTAIGLGTAATNPSTAFQPASANLTNLAANNGSGLTNLTAANITGSVAIANGGSGATTAGGARTNLGLGTADSVAFQQVSVTHNDLSSGFFQFGGAFFEAGGTNYTNVFNFFGDQAANLRALARTNLGLGATWLTNDNVTNFRTAIGLGATNDVRFNEIDATSRFRVNDGSSTFVQIADDVAEFFIPVNIFNENGLDFGGTNAAVARGQTRTNLGLPLPALTNTSNVTFQGAIFPATTTNAPTNTNAPTPDAWLDIQVGTNSYKLPLWQ
jgi:hypothetical protein